jgi:hypothetical protein
MERRSSRATFSPIRQKERGVSGMSNLMEKFEKNPISTEIEEKEWGLFENREAELRNQKHLEMAYEWLRSRGKIVVLKGGIESL